MKKDGNISEISAVTMGILLATGILLLASMNVFAAPPQRPATINSVTTTCKKITNNSWTAVPSTTSILGTRQNLFITNATTDTIVGTFDATVAISTGITPYVVPPKWTSQLPLGPNIGMYFRSLGNGESNVCVDEVTHP